MRHVIPPFPVPLLRRPQLRRRSADRIAASAALNTAEQHSSERSVGRYDSDASDMDFVVADRVGRERALISTCLDVAVAAPSPVGGAAAFRM
jgi:hypothetical protein